MEHFDETLKQFWEHALTDSKLVAIDSFASLLQARISLCRSRSQKAAEVLESVLTAVRTNALDWNHQTDLERLHTQGRELARHFYADSPWEETKKRLVRSCPLLVEHDVARPIQPLISYSSKYISTESKGIPIDVLRITFSFRENFTSYLALPFFFLHEYTAHIYAIDNRYNPRFNDGWMIYAVARFLERIPLAGHSDIELQLEQTDVFFRSNLLITLDRNSQNAFNIAARVDVLLSGLFPELFRSITYELAAFSPRPGEGLTWPSKFINALSSQLISSESMGHLIGQAQNFTNVREFLTSLQPR